MDAIFSRQFESREAAKAACSAVAKQEGFALAIRNKKPPGSDNPTYLLLRCSKGGAYRDQRNETVHESKRRNNTHSLKSECPFQINIKLKHEGPWAVAPSRSSGPHNHPFTMDFIFQAAYKAVQGCERAFPPSLGLKVQISECAIDAGKRLTFRDRIWVPGGSGEKGNQEEADKDQLRTRIVQQPHDSVATGHPGREGTLAIVARRFYWPGQSQLVRRFVANCDTCGRAHIWRQSKRGFLKPLPIPDRPRSHLSMDLITDLPPTGPSKSRYLWVIIDRLTKAVTLEVMDTMEAETCAQRFLQCHYRFHGMPRSIVSDRGSNWLSRFWKRFCQLAGISQRLSTAYHPQTDGGPERMNQEIEAYLRAYVSYVQEDWGELLPAAQLALNNRESAATKISPFFAEHGYHVDPISIQDSEEPPPDREESKAYGLLTRLQEVNEYTCKQ
ncbi:hypothetical protein HIM_09975 [Hirsutella minnesotensis 3608]|uniref:Integrase catalytic domain-containing protein n=1 Tax=Hirsutella minnesotensis 3608 TaxID=1043627 RepID=A0A0F7ZKM7_9HYPO|nr:hypothetical protein HIM_09975 [Hirsutella minnesotensis 3608]